MLVKDAVAKATEYFVELMGDKISDIWLEEVELSPDEKDWYVTLSALAPKRKTGDVTPNAALIIAGMIGSPVERLYRIFVVSNTKNDVTSMKIRTP